MADSDSSSGTDSPLMGTVSPFESGGSMVTTLPSEACEAVGVDEDDELFYRVRGDRIELQKTTSLDLFQD